ncbi:MAG: hypothetical protein Q7T12_01935 [Flavobacterium sp.]|nr:hypothetical protein [Flavobacterium sp.]
MAKKQKTPLYQMGDILYCTRWDCVVELLERHDVKPSQNVAWKVRNSPYTGSNDFCVPESELERITKTS